MTSKPITLPQDKDAEQFMLGSMLNSINAVNWGVQHLTVKDFYYPEHQVIFQVITDLYSQGFSCDLQIIVHKLQNQENKQKQVDFTLLFGLSTIGTGGIDFAYYGHLLKNLGHLRKIVYASKESIDDSVIPNADSQEIINSLQKKLFEIQDIGAKDIQTPSQILDNFYQGKSLNEHLDWVHEEVSKGNPPYIGIPSGYPILDKTLGFFRPACYYTIGARTSMGKTTFLLNLMKNMNSSFRKTRIGFFSLEMDSRILIKKLLCIYTGIRFTSLEDGICTPEELERIYYQSNILRDFPIFIEDQGGIKLSQLCARAKRMMQNHRIEILFIDYLTCIKADNKYPTNHLAVNEISKGLQSLAKELNIPIIALAQINRAAAQRTNPTPTLADFRESGSIEEDSDACIMLHRPDYYKSSDFPGIIKVIVAKNRLRGILKTIDFNMINGENYNELQTVKETFQKINEENFNESYKPYKD